MGEKDNKDKENTINTTHPQKKQTEMSVQKMKILMRTTPCFYTNADQLRNKLN